MPYNSLSMPSIDHDLLEAALAGYEHRLAAINVQIALLRASTGQTPSPTARPKARTLSAVARRKIAAAQRKRWAAVKQAKAAQAKPRRKMSAAARKRMGDAARRRWALVEGHAKGESSKIGSTGPFHHLSPRLFHGAPITKAIRRRRWPWPLYELPFSSTLMWKGHATDVLFHPTCKSSGREALFPLYRKSVL
jgi:hypothetical protein